MRSPLLIAWLIFLTALGLCSGLLFLSPQLIMFGLALMAVPNLWLYLSIGTAAGLAVGAWLPRWAAVGFGVVAAVAVGFGVPWVANLGVEGRVSAWTSEDVALAPVALSPEDVVVIWRPPLPKQRKLTEFEPGPLALRLLFNGAVSAVIEAAYVGDGRDAHVVATRWRLGPGGAAPRLRFLPRWSDEEGRAPDGLADRVALRIAGGDGLVGEPVEVPADAALVVAQTREAEAPGDGSLWPFDRRFTVERLEVRRADGARLARWTDVRAEPVGPVLLIGMIGGSPASYALALWRRPVRENPWTDDPYRAYRDLFGAAVDLPSAGAGGADAGPATPDDVRDLLEAALASPAGPPGSLVDRWLSAAERVPATERDLEVAAAVISDLRVRAFGFLSGAVFRWGAAADPLAEPIFGRMLAEPVDAGVIEGLADSVDRLPTAAIRRRADELRALASDPARRSPAADGLSRLADLGPESVPLLTELARTARSGPRTDVNLQLAALKGLCLLGPDAAPAEAEAWAVVDDRAARLWGTTALQHAFDVLTILGREAELAARVAGTEAADEWARHQRRQAPRCRG